MTFPEEDSLSPPPRLQTSTSASSQAGIPESRSAPTRRSPQRAPAASQPRPQLQGRGVRAPSEKTLPDSMSPRGFEDGREFPLPSTPRESFLLGPSWVPCNKTTMSSSKVVIGLLQQDKPCLRENMKNKDNIIISDTSLDFQGRKQTNKK